jgi:uncharacterized protein YuzE
MAQFHTSTGSANELTVRLDYDHEARASYQYVSDKPIVGTVERDGAYVDLAQDGTVVGIERLY